MARIETDQPMQGDLGAPDTDRPLRSTVDRLIALAGEGEVEVREVLDTFGNTSFSSLLLLPAIAVVSPLSGIPLFSSLCGLTIALISLQMLSRRKHIWMPGFVMRRRVRADRLKRALKRVDWFIDWLDGHTRPRLRWLTTAPANIVPQTVCALSGASMPFLELLPFSSSLLGAAVTLMALGFLARDGLYVLGAAGFVGLAASLPWMVLF